MTDSSELSTSGSDEEDDLDNETEDLCNEAPMCAHIGFALHSSFGTSLPSEVEELLATKGSFVISSCHLKTSFHATFLVEMEPALLHDGQSFQKAIVQILGAELGDKALFSHLKASGLARAMELASSAGVRVPKLFAIGCCQSLLGPLEFVVEEFIQTDTVEDECEAPDDERQRIVVEVETKLREVPISDISSLPHFDSLSTQLQWLMTFVSPWDESLARSLAVFAEHVLSSPLPPRRPVLLHQDLNSGNVLCSQRDGKWSLDAIIDWESAAIADPRSLSDEEPWCTARAFSVVTKGSWLAEQFTHGKLPRCELHELLEGYERAAWQLDQSGWLHYETWASRSQKARTCANMQLLSSEIFSPPPREAK